MEKQNYISPEIEVVDVQIEQGFATSPGNGSNTENPESGGWLPSF